MGSRNSDDPMDLGPFLQNYVMKNPFDQIALAADKDNPGPPKSAEKATRPKDKYVPILPKPVPVDKAENSEELLLKRVKCEEQEEEEDKENGSCGISPEVGGDCEDRDCSSPHGPGHIGGHVGSNIAYAMNLRHNRVSEVHIEPQHW